jgi:hypothetical protein
MKNVQSRLHLACPDTEGRADLAINALKTQVFIELIDFHPGFGTADATACGMDTNGMPSILNNVGSRR